MHNHKFTQSRDGVSQEPSVSLSAGDVVLVFVLVLVLVLSQRRAQGAA
jgi:hypothetical protein